MSIPAKILDGVTAEVAGDGHVLRGYHSRTNIAVQVQKTGTSQVDVEARCGATAPWVVVGSNVADGTITQVPHCYAIRVHITNYVSGAVSAWIA